MNNTTNLQIMIVDDHQMFIDGIKLLLETEKHIEIVAEANDGQQALDFLAHTNPQLIITDVSMPVLSGIEFTRQAKVLYPHIKILVLTMFNDKGIINELIEAEADGYILKNTGKRELLNAIDRIISNGAYFCNEAIPLLSKKSQHNSCVNESSKLTPREEEIIRLICREYSTPEIAEKLCISPYTVDTHRKNILKKTNTKTLVGLIKYAVTSHIVDFNDKDNL